MAKFAIYMPGNGDAPIAKVVLEAKQIFIYADAKKTTLTDENEEIISVIPPGALVYKVAEPEKKEGIAHFGYVDMSEQAHILKGEEIERLKEALAIQDEIISAKTDIIERLNMEIEDIRKGINGRDLTIAEKSERVGILENNNDHLKALINDLNDRVEKARLDENKTNYNQMRVEELNVELQGSDLLVKKLRRENELLSAQVKDERLKIENIAKAIKDSLENPLVG